MLLVAVCCTHILSYVDTMHSENFICRVNSRFQKMEWILVYIVLSIFASTRKLIIRTHPYI